jgi:tRNA (guanosine-2'-O-)-methyltransferase
VTPERRERVDGVLSRRQPDLTIVAENLHKPRNLSAVVRTCDSVGIPKIHVVSSHDEIRRHWHTSQGAEKWVRVATHDSTETACGLLHEQGFQILAANLSDRAVNYREIDYTLPTALLFGTELFGVSKAALHLADREIVIPMLGMSQSLNVSVACAVVLYEAVAQRHAAGMYEHSRLPLETLHRDRFEWLHPVVADYCRRHGLEYPQLDENGDLLSDPRAGPGLPPDPE